jgi:2'-5' RNA ligase
MPRTTRTFIAIAIPSPHGEKLTRLQAELAPAVPGARWTMAQPFHMTLAFLGDVADVDLNTLCRAVSEASAAIPRFEARVEGVGAFPDPARPRVIWAGLVAPDPSPLRELQKAVAKAATKAGYRPDDERFHPHITLGRIKSDRRGPRTLDLTPFLEPHGTWSAGSFVVSEVITFGSTLTPEGPVYTPLAKAPLAPRKTDASP